MPQSPYYYVAILLYIIAMYLCSKVVYNFAKSLRDLYVSIGIMYMICAFTCIQGNSPNLMPF